MLRKLEELRKQPKPVKDRVAFLVTSGVCAVIVLIWVVSIPSQFNNIPDMALPEDDQSGGFARAFGDLGSQMASVWSGLDEAFSEPPPEGMLPGGSSASSSQQAFDLSQMFATRTPFAVPPAESQLEATSIATSTTLNLVTDPAPVGGRTVLIATTSSPSD